MAIVAMNWSPTERQLRQFAWMCFAALLLGMWLLGHSRNAQIIAGGAGLALVSLAHLRPAAVRPIFVGAMLITAPIGLVLGELAMLVIYFFVLVPTGCASRLLGRDPLKLRREPDAETYWQKKDQPRDVRSYYRRY